MGRKLLVDMIKQASKKTDIAGEFINDLNYAIPKYEEMNERKPSPYFKPSSIRCIRCGVFQVLGATPTNTEVTPNLVGITQGGSAIHENIQRSLVEFPSAGLMQNWKYVDVVDYIKENKLDLEIIKPCDFANGEYETKIFSEEYQIRCLLDGVLQYKDKYVILEIKSINSSKFFKMKDVLDKHKAQAISYSMLMQIPDVLFLYVDRDLYNKKTFLYTPSAQEKGKWLNNINYGLECVKNKKIPAMPVVEDKDFCTYCAYKKLCKQIGNMECDFNEL